MEQIKRAWRGEERLWKVYWIYGAVIGVCFGIVHLMTAESGAAIQWLYYGVRVPYGIWLTVSIWRCAFNTSWSGWGYIARILTIISIIILAFSLLTSLMFGGQATVVVAECQNETKTYVAQGGMDPNGHMKECIKRHLRDGESGQGANSVPAEPLVVPPGQQKYKTACEKSMTDFAQKNGTDPRQYVLQNQPYLKQCIDYYAHASDGRKPN